MEAGAEFAKLLEGFDALTGCLGKQEVPRNKQVRIRLVHAPSNASTQLIELGETKRLRVVDDDGIGGGDIEARLNDCGTQQQVKAALQKLQHHGFQPPLRHLPVGHADATLRDKPEEQSLHGGERLNPIVHKKHLAATRQLSSDGPYDGLLSVRCHHGLDGTPPFRWRGNDAAIAQPNQRHVQGTWNRGGSQHQYVDLLAEALDLFFVGDPKTVLLVHYQES